jgi:hypothetical protein
MGYRLGISVAALCFGLLWRKTSSVVIGHAPLAAWER